ncbi:MAG: beta strand repeat-containing protein [Phycisphaerae bacterium]
MLTRRSSCALSLAVLSALAVRAYATTWSYTGASGGNWSLNTNWTSGALHQVPAAGDDAILGTSAATNAIFDSSYASALNSMTINASAVTAFTLNQTSAATTLRATSEYLGTTTYGGIYTQSAGNNIATNLYLGVTSGVNSQGTYNLSGAGNLTVTNEYIGGSTSTLLGGNVFNQSGGNNTATFVLVGGGNATVPGLGVYNLSGGNLSVSNSLGIGTYSPGSSMVVSGTGNATIGILQMSPNVGGSGNLTLNSASASINVTSDAFISTGGGGVLTVSNGTMSIGGNLIVSNVVGNAVNLSGGSLSVGTISTSSNPSRFNWTGGTFATGQTLSIDSGGPIGSALAFAAGKNLVVHDHGQVGYTTNGSINLSGGNVTFDSWMDIGSAALTVGSVAVSNGTLSLGGSSFWGNNGIANVTQTGGTINAGVGGTTYLGYGATGTGLVTLNGASAQFNGGTFLVGPTGAGTINVMNGCMTLQALDIYANGTVNLTGGTLSVGTLDTKGTPANLHWTAGTLKITGASGLSITGTGPLGDSYSMNSNQSLVVNSTLNIATDGYLQLYGGVITAAVLNTNGQPGNFYWYSGTLNLTASGLTIDPNGPLGANVYLNANKNLTTSGAINNYGNFSLNGGIVVSASLITNLAQFSNTWGIIGGAGGFNNRGYLQQGAGALSLATTGPLTNSGNMQLAAGYQTILNGSNLTNTGTIALNNGWISGAPTLVNSPGGTISGSGTIGAPLQNSGLLLATGGTLNVLSAFTNNGSIQLADPSATLAGGTITNADILQGAGQVASPVTNNATVQSAGGTLIFTGGFTNSASGTIAVPLGTEVLMQGAGNFPTNAGLISLTGGTFDNGGQVLNNTGAIVGYGTLRTGGLTNNGTFVLTGGTSTVNGNVTNAVGRTLSIKYQPAIFTGNITNSGTIKVTGTTVTYIGAYTGNAYISDPATNIFQSTATVTAGGSMTGGAGDLFNFSGTFTNNGTFNNGGALAVATAVVNTGTFTQSGPQSWAGGATFTNNGGSAAFQSNAKIYGLTITAGTFDVTGSKLIVQASAATKAATFSTLRNYILAHSLLSSGTPAHYGLALIDNGTLGAATFGGNAADANSLLVSQELLGDANIDGKVDLTDLSTVLNHFGAATPHWADGNFDYAATVNLTDLSDVLNNFGLVNPNPSSGVGAPGLETAIAVPEPISLFAIAGSILLLHRRPRRAWN